MPPHGVAPGVAGAVGGAYGGLVDGDAESGGVAAQGVPVDESEGRRVDEVGEEVGVLVVVDAPTLFLDEEVGGGERDLETGRQCDRAEGAVRGELGAVGLREGGDAVDLRDAAGVGEVGLGDGDAGGECGRNSARP